MANHTFWEIGIYKQDTAPNLVIAEREMNNSCNICFFKDTCEMRTDKYGVSQLEKCGIFKAHEKAVKRIIGNVTDKFVLNININLNGGNENE